MRLSSFTLGQLGWRPYFAQQVTLEDLAALVPARVTAVHRTVIEVLTEAGERQATPGGPASQHMLSTSIAVGDWVLLEPATARAIRILDRQSTLARLAAGERQQRQLIAANVDSLFIVMSCNEDFNLSRLERYLALAGDAAVEPVVVLTKVDLAPDASQQMDALRDIAPGLSVCPVNATSAPSVGVLTPWLDAGQTVAFVGSSGVGKSTLVNTLMNRTAQCTAGIRAGDGKGRHTTTSRHMFALPGGAWVIDTPGMRELKLEVGTGAVSAVFDDIEALATQCRFRDCAHQGDEGCAVSAAIERGNLDQRRFASYQKLLREAVHATRTIRERRESERQFGRMAKSVMKRKRMDSGRE